MVRIESARGSVLFFATSTVCREVPAAGPGHEDAYKFIRPPDARFNLPHDIMVSPAGGVVVVDCHNHALRLVSKAGAVRIMSR